ncbi:MAG TPA: hypothetical protein VLF69_02620 [Candidatus Saccharimonadales bacterium]|nr:hypothetical protein [Candidatus Saccharimonadales bacterium]
MAAPDNQEFFMRKPAAWDDLVGIAGDAYALDNDNPPVDSLYGRIATLGNNELEFARYRAIGLMVLDWKERVSDPVLRAAAIGRGATRIVAKHNSYCFTQSMNDSQGPYIGELKNATPSHRGNDRDPDIDVIFEQALPALVLVAESLECIERERRIYPHPSPARPEHLTGAELLRGEKTMQNLALNTTAASQVVQLALRIRQNRGPIPKGRSYDPRDDKPIFDVVSEGVLRRMGRDLLPLAEAAAALRRDEFVSGGLTHQLEDYLRVSYGGKRIVFDRKLMPKQLPAPPRLAGPLHTGRLRCPALYVPGAIKLALGMIPEIAIQARRGLEEEWIQPKYPLWL